MFNVEVHSRYLSRLDRYDNLPNISESRRFPGKICITHISQNIFFHMISNNSFHYIFERGAFPKLVNTFNAPNVSFSPIALLFYLFYIIEWQLFECRRRSYIHPGPHLAWPAVHVTQ